MLSVAPLAAAQVPPDSGRLLQGVKPLPELPGKPVSPLPQESTPPPALQAPQGLKIPVKGFRITGIRAFAEGELIALVQDGVGHELTLDELNSLAQRITSFYRKNGYLLARAYIPAQTIRDGVVEIAVLEGRLGQVRLDNSSAVSASVLNSQLSPLESGQAVQGESLERQLLLMSDLPGVEVRSTLRPGASVGTSDLDVKVTGTERFTGSLDVDNYGDRFTGDLRAGITANVNNALGRGDLFSVRAIDSGPGFSYARFAWQTPLAGNGLKAGTAWSDLHYRLQKDFAPLGAHGSAEVGTLWLSYPFLRSLRANLNGQLAYDHKTLDDRIDSNAIVADRALDVWTLGVSAVRQDAFGGGGITDFTASLTAGHLNLGLGAAAFDQSAVGLHTQGNYGKVLYNIARLQRITTGLALYAAFSGQQASKNLDSSEKFSLGGAYGVRAYPVGEAAGDDVWLANAELRWTPPGYQDVQLFAFVDSGGSRIRHSPLASDTNNERHLAGEGIGLAWGRFGNFALRAAIAWRWGPLPNSDVDRVPRAWLQAVKYF